MTIDFILTQGKEKEWNTAWELQTFHVKYEHSSVLFLLTDMRWNNWNAYRQWIIIVW